MAAEARTITPPDITGVIKQQFFIERLGGPQATRNYLERFPESLYNRGLGSNLVALLYTLLGPAGVGTLRQNYLLTRLLMESHGLRTTDLDALYANPFSFARLAEESYQEDTEGLLTQSQWENIIRSDRSYQNRSMNYLKALRAGGTLTGVTLAAKSGLDRAVEVVEGYKALYDQYADDPLGLEYIGVTDSTEEIILVPRQELPKSALITISTEGNPTKGGFKLALPLGEGETVAGFNAAKAAGGNNPETTELKWNTTFDIVQAALEALPRVGENINVRGGQFPGNPIEIEFKDHLADRPIPSLLVITNTLENENSEACALNVENTQVGVSADGEVATIPPEAYHYADVAIHNIKPVTTIVSLGRGPGITKRQVANAVTSDSEFIEVLRYATGNRQINWPARDTVHWVQSGVEREAPVAIDSQTAHYTCFHNIFGATAYTDAGIEDPKYESEEWFDILGPYISEQVGPFTPEQQTLYPVLKEWSEVNTEKPQAFPAVNAPVSPPETLTFHGEGTVGRSYPEDYLALAKDAETRGTFHSGNAIVKATVAPSLQDKPPAELTPFWASKSRVEGADFLEIDLGNVQACNYLTFEVINVPVNIGVAYDLLDASPERSFKAVTYSDEREAASVLSVGFNIETPNPWRTIEVHFENSLRQLIFTRVLRLEFNRRTGEKSPFTLSNGVKLPYSVEVRNLRVGRNIS